MNAQVIANVTGVAIGGRAVLIEGAPGSGKSSLALALIDRGAMLIGDDAVHVTRAGDKVIASAPPNTSGMIEVLNAGIIKLPVAAAPVALILRLYPDAPRFPMDLPTREIAGLEIPLLCFAPGDSIQALRAEYALERHGLPLPKSGETA